MAISLIKEEERHLLNALPIVLEKDHQFQITLYTVLSKTFATKDDLKQILEEMRRSREETNRRFEEMDRRFNAQQEELRLSREETNKRFEEMDRRFNAQLEEMHKGFEEGDKRFNAQLEELHKGFEEGDRRFNAQLEEMHKGFEEGDKRFNAQLEELRISREETNKRFEEAREETNKRFEEIVRQFEDLEDWVGVVVGGFQRRAGRKLEDAIAGTLRLALRRPDVKPENLKLRTKFIDDEGVIGPKDRKYEIDIYTHNGESLIFEVKSYLELEDVYRFHDKAELAKKKFKLPHSSKVIVSLERDREITQVCEEMGIILA